MRGFTRLYGDSAFHLIILLAVFALAAYTISVLGFDSLVNPDVWWQSIAVWFAVAVIAHDLVLFPLYALIDRLLSRPRRTGAPPRGVRLTNYVRIPSMAATLLLLMFLPGIIAQGAASYVSATGLTQEPFLTRWLLITAALYLVSALWYVVKIVVRQSHVKAPATRQSPTRRSQ